MCVEGFILRREGFILGDFRSCVCVFLAVGVACRCWCGCSSSWKQQTPALCPACRYGELTELMLGGGEDGGELFCFVQFRCVQPWAFSLVQVRVLRPAVIHAFTSWACPLHAQAYPGCSPCPPRHSLPHHPGAGGQQAAHRCVQGA